MPFVSFNLRSTGGGSELRNSAALDGAIRGDGYIPPSVALSGSTESTFGVNVISIAKNPLESNPSLYTYTSVFDLEWALSTSLVASSASPPSAAPQATRFRIVVSPYGEPITVLDGTTIKDYDYLSFTNSTQYTTTLARPGDWLYFGIFFEYEQTISGASASKVSWYERLTTLSVQVPFLHKSTESLWKRIPEYYRQQDEEYRNTAEYINIAQSAGAPEGYEAYGPLYRYLDLFGWELDRTRSLIDTLFTMKDPYVAKTEALERLCQLMGTEIDTESLGAAKARALLDNIGYLRRRKGTIGCITAYINALTGCGATYNASLSSGASAYFDVYTQRANLIPNPRFVGSTNYTVGAETPGVVTVTSASAGGPLTLTASSATKVAIQTTWRPPINSGASANKYYMSFTTSASSYPSTVYGGQWATGTGGASFTAWGTLSASASYIEANGRRYYEMPAATSGSYYPVLTLRLQAGETASISQWMLEPNNIGAYFDGSTFVGGYTRPVDPTTAGLSDFRWGKNSDSYSASYGLRNNEFSYYTLDYARVKSKVTSVINNNIKPIGTTIILNWNVLPT